jgi:hypothetical protein
MKLRNRNLVVLLILNLLLPFPTFGKEKVSANIETIGGLHITTFETAQGRIKVNLPDDMAVGDTISGTVIAEPVGETKEEERENRDELNGYVIEVERARRRP